MYNYLVSEGKIGLILNPDVAPENPWVVSFNHLEEPVIIQDVDPELWFGESSDGFVNYRSAQLALGEVPSGYRRHPFPKGVGSALGLRRIPYAGGWSGGTSFSRSICAGNYTFGARVHGFPTPVWLDMNWERFILGWYAEDEVSIECWAGGKKWVEKIPPKSYWASVEGIARRIYRAFPVLGEKPVQESVDILGRW